MSAKPIIALLATGGVDELLANSLAGLTAVGVPLADVVIGCLPQSEAMVRRVAAGRPVTIRLVDPPVGVDLDAYKPYGSTGFREVSWLKVRLVRDLLRDHHRVIYADLDVAWLRDPRPYLDAVTARFPIAIQSEAQPVFPPKLCCGFMSFARDDLSVAFLDAWLAGDRPGAPDRVDDQTTCQQLVEDEPAWLDAIHVLPEALFPVGISYGIVRPHEAAAGIAHAQVAPFVFHANWTVGTHNKRRLMEVTGTWVATEASRPAPADGAPTPLVLMRRWFGIVRAAWRKDTWPRIHRAAFTIRRNLFDEMGSVRGEHGQLAPPLRRSLTISGLRRAAGSRLGGG